ncbi:SRPBCC family protein [Pontibacter arcticus]|uniref:Polyketide cyclase / dehydrase and lipid transport n=1 Tax=Pontibacter arcticus TaxID=2080288 RepID=A0A364RGA5_9BACT|nr:SRPBCC family protein [Pontibacter arcticus]RAU83331.1 hypothetical protein DP923_08985 [Pontibacter arcticus]
MRLLFKVLAPSLLFLGGAAFIAVDYLPEQIEIKKQLVVGADPEQVYTYLQNPTDWPHWSALGKAHDPSVIHLYGGPRTGSGARMQWSGDKLGNGHLVLNETTSPALLTYTQLTNGDTDSTFGVFILTEVKGGTQINWSQRMQLEPTKLAKLKGVLRKYKMEQQQEQGLLGLKTLLLENSKKRAENKTR